MQNRVLITSIVIYALAMPIIIPAQTGKVTGVTKFDKSVEIVIS